MLKHSWPTVGQTHFRRNETNLRSIHSIVTTIPTLLNSERKKKEIFDFIFFSVLFSLWLRRMNEPWFFNAHWLLSYDINFFPLIFCYSNKQQLGYVRPNGLTNNRFRISHEKNVKIYLLFEFIAKEFIFSRYNCSSSHPKPSALSLDFFSRLSSNCVWFIMRINHIIIRLSNFFFAHQHGLTQCRINDI